MKNNQCRTSTISLLMKNTNKGKGMNYYMANRDSLRKVTGPLGISISVDNLSCLPIRRPLETRVPFSHQ